MLFPRRQRRRPDLVKYFVAALVCMLLLQVSPCRENSSLYTNHNPRGWFGPQWGRVVQIFTYDYIFKNLFQSLLKIIWSESLRIVWKHPQIFNLKISKKNIFIQFFFQYIAQIFCIWHLIKPFYVYCCSIERCAPLVIPPQAMFRGGYIRSTSSVCLSVRTFACPSVCIRNFVPL